MKRRLLALSLALSALLAGCAGGGDGPKEGEVTLYWPASQNTADGAALDREYRTLAPAATGQPAPEGLEEIPLLMAALEAGPLTPDWTSPFPAGTRFQRWELDGEGVLHLDLSEHYGGLSGMELSLADACIVLTFCQLPQVKAVSLTVAGRPRPFRDTLLSPQDLLLDNGSAPEGRLEAGLWFPGGEGMLREERTLNLAIGDEAVTAILQALLAGSEGADLCPVAPEGTRLLGVWKEETGYRVDLSADFGEQSPQARAEGEAALVRTLWELGEPLLVTIQIEGETVSQWPAGPNSDWE